MLYRAVLIVVLTGCRFHFDAVAEDDGGPTGSQVTVTVVGHGIALVGGQVGCADQCTYATGPLDLSPMAGEGWELDTFSAPCTGQPTCTAPPGSSITLTFRRAPFTANVMFVSSVAAPMTGLASLDGLCAARAAAGGLTGDFVAFVSTSTQDAIARVGTARGWVRRDGLPLFDTIADVGLQTIRSIGLDEMGTPVESVAVTGSDSAGVKTANNCNDWTVTSGPVDAGQASFTPPYAVGGSSVSCVSSLPLYCIQRDRTVAVSLSPPPMPIGRYVFASTNQISLGGGIAAADATCASDAAAAGLAGTFRAVLATTTQSAADHIGGTAGLWRRPDGIVVSFTGLDQPSLDAVIDVDATGALRVYNLAYGATGLTALGTATCADWTSTTDAPLVMTPESTTIFTRVALGSPCSSLSIMCAQLP